MHWRTASGLLDLEQPRFLGILNITPDSFSDGGLHAEPAAAVARALRLADRGAAVLDVGAESTRPGAAPLPPSAEWLRLSPVLDRLREALPGIPLSLDTRHAQVAQKGLAAGVSIINDVTGFSSPELLELVRGSGCGLIAMRSRTRNGHLLMPEYGGMGEPGPEAAIQELAQVRDRLLGAGIHADRILLDPGFGFGTTYREDLALWEALPELPGRLEWPVERFCIGISRKRFIAWRAGTPELAPSLRDGRTHEAHAEALTWGYRVFRTHDVLPLTKGMDR